MFAVEVTPDTALTVERGLDVVQACHEECNALAKATAKVDETKWKIREHKVKEKKFQ